MQTLASNDGTVLVFAIWDYIFYTMTESGDAVNIFTYVTGFFSWCTEQGDDFVPLIFTL